VLRDKKVVVFVRFRAAQAEQAEQIESGGAGCWHGASAGMARVCGMLAQRSVPLTPLTPLNIQLTPQIRSGGAM
jgi:hypothetical protein